jgi:hypothetical protein
MLKAFSRSQAGEAAIRKRLKANTGSAYLSFDTGLCESIGLDKPQVRSGRVRYLCDGVTMSQPRWNDAYHKGTDLGGSSRKQVIYLSTPT